MGSTNIFGAVPITLSGSVLVNTNNLTLPGSSVLNFGLGTNDTTVAVTGNLTVNSTLNITNAAGFTATNYTLFTYTGSLGGHPVLGTTPTGFTNYTYSLNTDTAGEIIFVVSAPPLITTQPTDQAVTVGRSSSFTAVASGSAPFSYQWYFNTDTALVNETNATLTLTNVQLGQAGTYSVLVTNEYGSITSSNAVLTVTLPRPPLANTDTFYRTKGLSLKILKSDLLTNDSDPDGYYPLTLTGINLLTTNGVTLMTNNTLIFYTNNVDVNDSFAYTIMNTAGSNATGTVNIIIAGSLYGQSGGTVIVTAGKVMAAFAGIPGTSYYVQRATNVSFTLGISNFPAQAAPASGLFQVEDGFEDLGGPPSRAFYRLMLQ